MDSQQLNERSQLLLRCLVARFIEDGQPVGSKALSDSAPLKLSPATIRSILSELEEKGYLRSPHTSAGRVPTTQGYRCFIDGLVSVKGLDNKQIYTLANKLGSNHDADGLVHQASTLLTDLTQLTGLVTLPHYETMMLRHIEFLPLSDKRVLTIIVFNNKEVQNRIFSTDRQYTSQELEQYGNYLTSVYKGLDLSLIRERIVRAMQADRKQMDTFSLAALTVADKALAQAKCEKDYIMSGQDNLMDIASEVGLTQLQELFVAFSEKQDILHILDRCLDADGVKIFIGDELGQACLEQCSLVSAPYRVENQVAGVLGVIGGARMPYEQVIAKVDITAKLLSAAMGELALES